LAVGHTAESEVVLREDRTAPKEVVHSCRSDSVVRVAAKEDRPKIQPRVAASEEVILDAKAGETEEEATVELLAEKPVPPQAPPHRLEVERMSPLHQEERPTARHRCRCWISQEDSYRILTLCEPSISLRASLKVPTLPRQWRKVGHAARNHHRCRIRNRLRDGSPDQQAVLTAEPESPR
jgi:hypothetical protein